MMNRDEAKEMFRNDKDSYGKYKGVMGKIDLIYDDFERVILSKHTLDKEKAIKFMKEQKEELHTLYDKLMKERK